MKKALKSGLALFLAFVMVFGGAPLSALAGMELSLPEWLKSPFSFFANAENHSGKCGTSLTWKLDTSTGVLTISGAGPMYDWSSYSSVPWYGYCSSVKSVNMDYNVTSLGGYAFCSCTGLTSITIRENVTGIGDSAFSYCTSMTSVIIGNSVKSIGSYAFQGCYSLIGVTIPNSVTSIGKYAFSSCSGLTRVTIPNSVTSIGDGAFCSCKSLTSVTIPNNVTSIGNAVFSSCSGLIGVNIPSRVTSIGHSAFANCTSLTSITIPNSVTSIGDSGFSHCYSLTSITIPNSVTSIGDGVFYYCKSLTSITVNSENQYYSNDSYGVLFNKGKTKLIQYPIGNTRMSYTVPNRVTSVGENAFRFCTSLTRVSIQNSVTCIEDCAFADCKSLTSIAIPNSVISIGDTAFGYCTSLTGMTIPNSVTSIGEYAFYYCTGLTSIIIGNSVTSIGEIAFYNCTNLNDVYYAGSQSQWSAISIGDYNTPLTSATIHYNYTIPVTGISLDKESLALIALETALLTVTVSPADAANKSVTWSSSDKNVATVDSTGLVTAIAAGTATITVTANDTTNGTINDTCTVTVTPVTLTSIVKKTLPNKTSYYVGDTLDTTGLTLTATYNNGTKLTISSGFNCAPMLLNTAGTQEITVTYGGKTCPFDVTVTAVALTKIEIKTLPDKTDYYVGDTLDTTGLTLTATYNNGHTVTITTGFTCDPMVLNTAGTQTITVTYGGKTCPFDVTVTAVVLIKIEIKIPLKCQYFYVGDTLDPTGLTLIATYNNGTTRRITEGFTCAPMVLNTAGTQTITVTFEGKTCTFEVTVTAVALTKIEIKTLPNKTSYYVGDTLDKTGLTLTATYNNGHTDTITTGFTCNPTALNTAGTQTITVTYGGKDCTFPVTVSRINASGLVIAVIPSQTYTGLEITPFLTVTYNGVPLSPVTEYTAAYTNNINAGTATVTVTGIGRYTGTKTATFTILPRNISYAIADIIPDREYTGSEITPDVALYDNGKALISGTDYTTAYADNITIGTATVTLTGKGNYTGTKTVNFQIVRTIEPTFTVADIANQKYTGFGINPAVKAYSKADNSRLTNTIDYTANYRNNILPGTATAVVTGRGSHSGVVDKDFGIVRESITAATVEAIPDMTETGGALTPVPVLTYKGRQLVLGVDFTAEYANNVNPGTATVTITGIGGFEGTTETTFTIVENTADFSVDALPDEVYTGGALTPDVIVRDGLTVLEINVDYTVSYTYNINVGYAVVTITGIGAYGGTFTVVFCILSASIETAIVPAIPNVVFDNKEITPDFGDMTITYGGVTLEIDVDFKVEIYNNYDVGTATIILIGIGNFSGMIQITFNITSAPADSFTVGTIGGATYTGGAVTPAFSVTYGGVTLRINVDYTVVFVNNVNVGTATVIITGIGNYSGETRVTFTINAANASGFTVTAIPDETYTGSAITPTVVVKFNGKTLVLDTDYTVAYTNNTNVGTATVTITGMGNFTGTTTETFNINPANISSCEVTAIPDQTYTGSAITPGVVVKFNGETLTLNTDYTVVYTNNTNVGTATVTITGKGNFTGTKTATFKIISSEIAVTGITLSSTALSLQYKGTSKLTATVNPTNATNKNVTWKSSNEKVAIVDANGNVTATGTGTATITATTVDSGKTASCTVTVKLVWWQWLIKIILFGWIWY